MAKSGLGVVWCTFAVWLNMGIDMIGVEFLSGISMATFAASAIFFLKFWKVSRDRLYLMFCISCTLLSVERLVLLAVRDTDPSMGPAVTEANSWVYLIRLAAFLVILVGVIDKNYPSGGSADLSKKL